MAYGRKIELFLVNGTTDSLITAKLSNWNGMAIKIPRTEVSTCNRADIKGAGVYFLICQEDDGTNSVYIGETENIQERLIQHLHNYNSGSVAYYWNTAVILLGRDLNKASIRYLEHCFVETAKICRQYSVLTNITCSNIVLGEADKASLEEFIDNAKTLINVLGYKIFVPAPVASGDTRFFFCNGNGASAKGFTSTNGFTVLAGSTVSKDTVSSFKNRASTYYNLRNDLINRGVITEGKFRFFTEKCGINKITY